MGSITQQMPNVLHRAAALQAGCVASTLLSEEHRPSLSVHKARALCEHDLWSHLKCLVPSCKAWNAASTGVWQQIGPTPGQQLQQEVLGGQSIAPHSQVQQVQGLLASALCSQLGLAGLHWEGHAACVQLLHQDCMQPGHLSRQKYCNAATRVQMHIYWIQTAY